MRSQLTHHRSPDLVQLPTGCALHCVLALVRKTHTKLCTVCAPLGCSNSALSADSDGWNDPRTFHCCLILFICMVRRRRCGCPSWDAFVAGTTWMVSSAGCLPTTYPTLQYSESWFCRVSHLFTQLDFWCIGILLPFHPGELDDLAVTRDTANKIFCTVVTAHVSRLVLPYSVPHPMVLLPACAT